MDTAQKSKIRPVLLVAVIISGSIAMATVFIVLGILSVNDPGTQIASLDVRSGEPFELRFISNGKNVHVWLNLECDECSYPVNGKMLLMTGGQPVKSVEISAGGTRHGGWEGGTKSLSWREVFEAKAQTSGKAMILSGTLFVYGARDFFFRKVRKDAPPPRVRMLRITVTD